MQYVRFGTTGMKVSRICLGCWSFGTEDWMLGPEQAHPIIHKALDLGITFFDTADIYSYGRSEEILGEALKGYREDVIIGTKVYFPMGEGPNELGLSRVHIMRQIKASLKRLQTNYIDLYHMHRWDYETPIEETLRTLNNLVHQGKVRYIAASSMYAWQLAKALWTSDRLGIERFESMESQYNLCYREAERELINLCIDQGIAFMPWSPLAMGFLTGIYKRDENHESPRFKHTLVKERYFRPVDFDIIERVEEIAANKGVKPAQIALAWLLNKEYVVP